MAMKSSGMTRTGVMCGWWRGGIVAMSSARGRKQALSDEPGGKRQQQDIGASRTASWRTASADATAQRRDRGSIGGDGCWNKRARKQTGAAQRRRAARNR